MIATATTVQKIGLRSKACMTPSPPHVASLVLPAATANGIAARGGRSDRLWVPDPADRLGVGEECVTRELDGIEGASPFLFVPCSARVGSHDRDVTEIGPVA